MGGLEQRRAAGGRARRSEGDNPRRFQLGRIGNHLEAT